MSYESTNYEPIDCEIKFVKTHPDAKLPVKNHTDPLTGDVGYDIFSIERTYIKSWDSYVVPVGITVGYITPGWWFRIEPRSGLGFKHSIEPHMGIIDNPYRGCMGIKLFNLSDLSVEIEKGKAVAQFIVYRMYKTLVSWIDKPTETIRGSNGFGSSGR